MLRATAGAALSFDYDLELRIGVALDLYVGGLQDGAAGGPELEVNKELFERWRAGVRLFGGIGGGGQEAMVGLRLRNAPLVFGVDAVFARGGDGAEFTYSNGVIASVGVDGKGAKYILVIGAGAFVLLAVLAVVALGAGGGGH